MNSQLAVFTKEGASFKKTGTTLYGPVSTNDPAGLLTMHEAVLVEGAASQANAMRWEDYTQTAMDPSDDCTIWYVGDYVKTGAATYSTRIGAFRLPGCPG